jgi:uncharacterized protein (TIGR00369 family)
MELTLDLGRRFLEQQPFSRLLGARLTRLDSGCAELEVDLRADLLQQNGFAHGGVVCYLADNALTYAGGLALGSAVVTSEFKINYVRPAIGQRASARAEVVHAGKRQVVCRCDVFAVDDGTEKLVATALGTIALAGTKSTEG